MLHTGNAADVGYRFLGQVDVLAEHVGTGGDREHIRAQHRELLLDQRLTGGGDADDGNHRGNANGNAQ